MVGVHNFGPHSGARKKGGPVEYFYGWDNFENNAYMSTPEEDKCFWATELKEPPDALGTDTVTYL